MITGEAIISRNCWSSMFRAYRLEREKQAGVSDVLRGDLLAEQLEGFLAGAADLLVHLRRPGLHLLVHPVTAALAVDDADAFADRVEDQVRLLGDRVRVRAGGNRRVGEDGVEVVVAQRLDRLVDRSRSRRRHNDCGEILHGGRVDRRLTRKDQNFRTRIVQARAAPACA